MTSVLKQLLDLESLRWGVENVSLRFAVSMPTWAWTGIFLAVILFSFWSYLRLQGHIASRVMLATIRATLLSVVIMLLAQPQLVERTEHTERDWVVALVDRSASLQLPDAPGSTGRIQREAQLHNILDASWPMWEELQQDRVVVWMGFDQYTRDISLADKSLQLGIPDGPRTNLSSALDDALRRALARPLAGVVIFSDGRSIEYPSRDAIRRLQRDLVPVFTVPLGSDIPIDDIAIQEVALPESAFASDITPIGVRVTRTLDTEPRTITVRLLDADTKEVLDQQDITWRSNESESVVTLAQQSSDPGEHNWIVELLTQDQDLVEDNNTKEISIKIVDRPLRVLYVDGYPRWEQRYVKNLLLRENSIRSSNILLAPNRRFLQESEEEMYSLPVSIEDWAQFDVVVLGDVSPDVFSREQLRSLKEHIATRGGGIVWIGGTGYTPGAWRESPLSDLLPFASSPSSVQSNPSPVTLTPTESSFDLGVLRLGDIANPWPAELSDPRTGWSVLRWSQRIDPAMLKPASVPLAIAHDSINDESWPLVISMRYGSGRVVYVGTDEIWRWRYGQGELLPERFWLQLIRMVGRESLAKEDKPAILEATPSRVTVQQPVRIQLTLLDQSLLDTAPESISLQLTTKPSASGIEYSPIEMELRPETRGQGVYIGSWIPTRPGSWEIKALNVTRHNEPLITRVQVTHPNDEYRDPRTNHASLARLSQETGGQTLDETSILDLPTLLPNRKQRLIREQTEPLWDTPLALLIVLSLLTAEWIGRRLIRLV
jgi:hypothetical protein